MHCRWPKFHNIQKELAESRFDLHANVVVLEKLDGSNLGIEISPTDGLIALHGRNGLLWSSREKSKEPFARRYGSVRGTLEPLADIIDNLKKLALKLLEELATNEYWDETASEDPPKAIIFYGEWYKEMGRDTTPSWRPFGYAFRGKTNHFRTMTSDLHSIFTEHGLHPPKMMFSGGNLFKAVEELWMIMKEGGSGFEGVFITSEKGGTRNCCKWKTGFYEEQSNFLLASESSGTEEMSTMVDRLRDVLDTKSESSRCSKPRAKKEKKTKSNGKCKDLAYDHMITLAMNSVLSKSSVAIEDIRAMEKSQKINEAKRLNQETLEDIMDSMADSGEEKMSEEELQNMKKRVGKVVSSFVMRS